MWFPTAYFRENILTPLSRAHGNRDRFPSKTNLIICLDNGRPHVSKAHVEFVAETGIHRAPHLPYSQTPLQATIGFSVIRKENDAIKNLNHLRNRGSRRPVSGRGSDPNVFVNIPRLDRKTATSHSP
jgi:hypothetical protein